MRVYIQPEHQIQRIHVLLKMLDQYHSLSDNNLKDKPSPTSWSVLEVIRHCVIAQRAYENKITKVFDENTLNKGGFNQLKCSMISSYLIKSLSPKAGKIRFKMKTLKQFQPLINVNTAISSETLNELERTLNQLKSWIHYYTTHPISLRKFNSAIGPVIRFNIPEACEFILSHHERHFFQIENMIDKIKGQGYN